MQSSQRQSTVHPRPWVPVVVALVTIAWFHGIVLVSEFFPLSGTNASGLSFWQRTTADETWYCRIAEEGYTREVPSYRVNSSLPFSPGWPMLLRAAHLLTGLPVVALRLPVAAGCFMIACCLLWRLLHGFSADARRNTWILALFALSPGSMYFLSGYSEALYLPELILFFLLLLRDRFIAAAGVASLALFTRNPAVVLVAVLGMAIIGRNFYNQPNRRGLTRATGQLAISMPICAIGLLGYIAITFAYTGDPWSFYKSYVSWRLVDQSHLHTLKLSGPAHAIDLGWSANIPSMVTAGIFATVLPIMVFAQRAAMPWVFTLLVFVAWPFFLYRNPPISEPNNLLRWLAPLFPFHIALVFCLEKLGRFRNITFSMLLVGFASLYAVNVYRFVHRLWVS